MQFFEELPPSRTGRISPINWIEAKNQLVANPGMWGLMAENISSSTPAQLRAGKNKQFRGDELLNFEFRVRKPDNPEVPYAPRRTDLFGRYIVA